MKKVILIGDNAEQSCLDQANNCLNHTRNESDVILFPDTHTGYGIPIGCLCVLNQHVSPNMVGADIGCGIRTFKTNIKMPELMENGKFKLKQIMSLVRNCVPVGFEWNKSYDKENLPISIKRIPGLSSIGDFSSIIRQNYEKIVLQYGTLGGGNHFIEFQKDKDDYLWVMIHCGSRNIGKLVGDHFNNIIKTSGFFNKKDVENDIGSFDITSDAGKAYLRDMQWCLDFALDNRARISELIFKCIKEIFPSAQKTKDLDIHHNYAQIVNVDVITKVKTKVIHRKGCVDISQQLGIIAGSQGTNSYIVEKGEKSEDYLWTCSHGSGRVLGRREAIRTLDLEKEKKILNDLGILHAIRNQDDLQEATSCYKDIHKVIKAQVDAKIIKVVTELTPIAVIKG